MIIPVRCFTCGKVIGDIWDKYVELNEIQPTEDTLNQLGLNKMCCRRMMITHVNLIDKIIKYNKYENTQNQKNIKEKE